MRTPFFLAVIIVFFSCNASALCGFFGLGGDCPCDSSGSKDGCRDAYNSVRDVNDQNDWRDFFSPEIRVRNSRGCYFFKNTSNTLNVGDCRYVCPQNVTAFKAACDPPTNPNSTEVNLNNGSGTVPCICASRVTSCKYTDMNDHKTVFNQNIGCYLIPMGPPPPPFCDNATEQPVNTTIVPVRDASYFDPKIKVRVGIDVRRQCANGDEATIAESCIGGTTEAILSYTEDILRPGESTKITYNNENYDFSAFIDDDKMCARYNNVIPAFSKEQCYEIPPMSLPEIQSYNNNTVSVIIDGYNNNQPFDISYGQTHGDTGLYLVKPKLDATQDVVYNSDGSVSEDPNSSRVCLSMVGVANDGSAINKFFNDYSITRNSQVVRFKGLESVFVPIKYDSNIGGFITDNNPSRNNINIVDTNQNILDTVLLNFDNTINMRPILAAQEKFRYQVPNIEIGGTTTYVTIPDNKPIILTDQEIKDMKPTDLNTMGLCKLKTTPGYVDFTETITDEYYTVDFVNNVCNTVTIEAWGAGSGGGDGVYYYAGSAGGYTKAKISLHANDVEKTFRMKIGKGSYDASGNGEDTTVWLCRDDGGGCERLLTAKGGKTMSAERSGGGGTAEKGEATHSSLFAIETLRGNPAVDPFVGENQIPAPLKLPEPPILDNNGNPMQYLILDKHMIPYRSTVCFNATSGKKERQKIPGAGTCVSEGGSYQYAGHGLVRLTCE